MAKKSWHHTEETKERISKKLKERLKIPQNNPFWHHHHTEETKQKLREKSSKYRHSKEAKEKISLKAKKRWQNPSFDVEERNRKISQKKKGQGRGISLEERWGKERANKFKKNLKNLNKKRWANKENINKFSGNNNPNWQGGISFEPYGQEFNRWLKEKIRQRDGYRCQECFRHQNELYRKGRKYSLLIHHIDYNKKNNSPDNLISLCNDCHSQTNFSRQNWTAYLREKNINRNVTLI